ncbi:hypothetical protein HY572_00460 [Candidatus Micrarchaeota archaeon]|nr:hypothetical protein [Candidatus Micrarchaeota archaeon]
MHALYVPTFFYSTDDAAGVNAANALRHARLNRPLKINGFAAWRFDGFDLVETGSRTVQFQDADLFETDLVVFLSRHASASKTPCFTCHVTGNFGPANPDMGGRDGTLSRASAFWLKRFYLALQERAGHVFLEATHHGPTLQTPSLFVEIGSEGAEWKKPENGVALAESVLAALSRKDEGKAALGLGGAHYCSAFAPLMQEGWALSHVASKHSVGFVTKDLVKQAVEKTVEPVEHVFLDFKGLPAEKKKEIPAWCEQLGLAWERV